MNVLTCLTDHPPAGEILAQSLQPLERNIHPVVIISAFNKALKEALEVIDRISVPIDTSNDEENEDKGVIIRPHCS